MELLILVLWDLIIGLMLWIDTRHYGNIITPFSVIGFMYCVLVNLNDLVASPIYQFHRVSIGAKGILFLFLLLVFLIDYFFAWYLQRSGEKGLGKSIIQSNGLGKSAVQSNGVGKSIIQSYGVGHYYVVAALFLLGAFSYVLSFVRLYAAHGLSIKGQNNGILGHLSFLGFTLAPMFLYMTWKQKGVFRKLFALAAVLGVFGVSLLFGGKYVFFINLCYFIFYFILVSRKKVRFYSILLIGGALAGVAVIVFLFLYLVIPTLTGQYQSSVGFAVEHFFYYLLSPVIANNYTLLHPGLGDPLIPVAFFVNTAKAIFGTGSYVDTILTFDFRSSFYEITNVSGIFGELVYTAGIAGSIVHTILIFTGINLVYVASRKSGRYALTASLSLGVLAFSFFANMFSNSGIMEPLILVLLLETVLQLLQLSPFVFRPKRNVGNRLRRSVENQ